jgi:hypothetical protein
VLLNTTKEDGMGQTATIFFKVWVQKEELLRALSKREIEMLLAMSGAEEKVR